MHDTEEYTRNTTQRKQKQSTVGRKKLGSPSFNREQDHKNKTQGGGSQKNSYT